jgi:hypothetical protein
MVSSSTPLTSIGAAPERASTLRWPLVHRARSKRRRWHLLPISILTATSIDRTRCIVTIMHMATIIKHRPRELWCPTILPSQVSCPTSVQAILLNGCYSLGACASVAISDPALARGSRPDLERALGLANHRNGCVARARRVRAGGGCVRVQRHSGHIDNKCRWICLAVYVWS